MTCSPLSPYPARRGALALLALSLCLGACPAPSVVQDSGSSEDGAGAAIDAATDSGRADVPATDVARDSASAPDRSTPLDAAVPDLAPGDLGQPDLIVASDGSMPDTSPDAAGPDASSADAAMPPRSRALQWVRDNPMFISGLTVVMAAPPADFVHAYFDGFHATAVHLWQTGLPDEQAGWAAAGRSDLRWLSWLNQAGNSSANGQLLGGLTTPPAGRIGYQLWDEPGDYAEFLSMRAGFDAVRGADPGALIVMNHMSGADEVERMCDEYLGNWGGDILSYDAYTRSNSAYGKLALFRERALAHGAPYWRYLKSYYAADGDDPLDASDLRWDAFSGAVYGYTGHTWFLYQIEPTNPDLVPAFFSIKGDFSSATTAEWANAAQLNTELAHLGRALVLLTSTDVRYQSTWAVTQPAGTSAWSAGAGQDPFLSALEPAPGNSFLELLVGFFVDDAGETYAMVQNVRHAHGDWPIDSNNPGTARLEFDFSSAPVTVDRSTLLQLEQATGNVVEKSLTPIDGNHSRLDVRLAAGDVFFFKYKTGQPFVLQP
ncbi:MAG: hypothetical protein ABIJ09_06230 [Pseudomonadota bacterium]